MAKAVIQKNWYEIQVPDIFDAEEITETPAEKDSQVIGRTVKENLTELMEDSGKYYVDVSFKVTEVEGNKAFTEIYGMECSSEYVSRMIRKRSRRLDVVKDFRTADNREVRIKVVGATVKKTSTNTLKDAREAITDILEEKTSEQSYNELMENIFMDNVQEELRDKVNKIYPFRDLEIRKTELRE
ncbi:MAG: ribosomal protein S3AE [Candidatus Nanohaloarchaea archaeon]|jgi:ribosomal protein S3AE